MQDFIEWSALGRILVVGLLVGAGLPALFALGVKAIAGPGARDASGTVQRSRLIAGWTCFGLVVAAIAGAIIYIAAGGH